MKKQCHNETEVALREEIRAIKKMYKLGRRIQMELENDNFRKVEIKLSQRREIINHLQSMINTSKTLSKPLAVIMPMGDRFEIGNAAVKAHEKCTESGLAVFADMEDAVRAIGNLTAFYEHIRSFA